MGGRSQGASASIAEVLAREIIAGVYPVGGRFVTDQALQDRFAVGRHSIREAQKILTERGLLGRRRKTGTFVLSSSPVAPYVHSLRDLRGLLDFAANTTLEIHHIGAISTNDKALTDLADLPDKRWLRVAGLRSVRENGVPLCWSEILVPERFSPPRETLLSTPRAIYEEIMIHNGFRLEYVEQEVTAALLPPAMAELLKPDGETAGLMVKRRYVSHTGETFEFSQNLYPAGRYTIRNVIRQRA